MTGISCFRIFPSRSSITLQDLVFCILTWFDATAARNLGFPVQGATMQKGSVFITGHR